MSNKDENARSGYIKLWRSTRNKGWYSEKYYLQVWVHLLLSASHKKKEFFVNGRTVVLEPGQFITSRKKMCRELRIERNRLERILKCFESEQQIEQQNLRTCRLITIINWSDYQDFEQQIEQQVSSRRAASEQQMSTIKNVKNVKKFKKTTKKPLPEDSFEFDLAQSFLNEKKKDFGEYKCIRDANLQAWADEIRKLKELDKKPESLIEEVLCYAAIDDDFWKKNLLTLTEIRKKNSSGITKFENIQRKMQRGRNGR